MYNDQLFFYDLIFAHNIFKIDRPVYTYRVYWRKY